MHYDSWKLETPEDEEARKSGRSPRRGVYRVLVTRTSATYVEVQASSEEDARFDAVIAARDLPADHKWENDYDTEDVEGPPERDPDDARDELMDREMER